MKSIRCCYTKDTRKSAANIVGVWIIIAVIYAIIIAAATGNNVLEHRKFREYNKFAAMANESFDTQQREILAEYKPEYADDLNEDGFFSERDEPVTFWDIIKENWWVSAIALLSCSATIVYLCCRDKDYYFADLPFTTSCGWFVLIACFIAWPFFLISRIRFQRFKKEYEAKKAEEKTRSETVVLPEIDPIFDEDAFAKFCHEMLPLKRRIRQAEKALAESEIRVRSLSEELKAATERLKGAQLKTSVYRANLNHLLEQEQSAAEDPQTREQIAHDFAQIKSMRGVKRIFVDDDGYLAITVRASYEYEGEMYDVGDFYITVNYHSLFAERYRGRGDECYGYNFCFGDKEDEIDSYVTEGRIVEAVELAIACINHINDDDLSSIPRRYKKIS